MVAPPLAWMNGRTTLNLDEWGEGAYLPHVAVAFRSPLEGRGQRGRCRGAATDKAAGPGRGAGPSPRAWPCWRSSRSWRSSARRAARSSPRGSGCLRAGVEERLLRSEREPVKAPGFRAGRNGVKIGLKCGLKKYKND